MKKGLIVLAPFALVIVSLILQDRFDRLERRGDALEHRLEMIEARTIAPRTRATGQERAAQESAAAPEVGAIVRFEPRRGAREMIVLKSTKHARGASCLPGLDDARLAVLDVKDGWVLVRYNRLGPAEAREADGPKACSDGTVGAVSIEGFQSYQAENACPSDQEDDVQRAIQLFAPAP